MCREHRSRFPCVCTQQGESLVAGSPKKQLALGDPEVIQEPPWTTKTITVDETTKGPKVIAEPTQVDPTSAWKIFVDGDKNSLEAGAGITLESPKGAIFEQYLRLNFPATNNEAE